MMTGILVSGSLLLLLLFPGALQIAICQTVTFERDYQELAELTADQEKKVLELVQKVGITNVARIFTYYVVPSTERGIGVKEKESVNGRHISYRVATICFRAWSPSRKLKKGALALGDYWISHVAQEDFTLLMIGLKGYRVRLQGDISAPEAERYLARFLKGDYEFEAGPRPQEVDQADFESTDHISVNNGMYVISCRGKQKARDRVFQLYFKPAGERLIIFRFQVIAA